jgi:cytochrome c
MLSFTPTGTKRVSLQGPDRACATAKSTANILVGNAPPSVAIDVTGNKSFYWNDAGVDYTVRVTDPEDGALGSGIDAGRVNVSLSYGPGGAPSAATSAGGQSASDPDGLARMRRSDCLACHGIDNASVGPSYVSVALLPTLLVTV